MDTDGELDVADLADGCSELVGAKTTREGAPLGTADNV